MRKFSWLRPVRVPLTVVLSPIRGALYGVVFIGLLLGGAPGMVSAQLPDDGDCDPMDGSVTGSHDDRIGGLIASSPSSRPGWCSSAGQILATVGLSSGAFLGGASFTSWASGFLFSAGGTYGPMMGTMGAAGAVLGGIGILGGLYIGYRCV